MESTPTEILKEIEALLNMLDGVSVLDVTGTIDTLSIELTIETHESHLLLEYCAEAANVYLQCWAQCKPWSDEAKTNPAQALCYRYYAKSRDNEPGGALKNFSLLGAFLVWSMYEVGAITGEDEKRLVKKFNAGSRSA